MRPDGAPLLAGMDIRAAPDAIEPMCSAALKFRSELPQHSGSPLHHPQANHAARHRNNLDECKPVHKGRRRYAHRIGGHVKHGPDKKGDSQRPGLAIMNLSHSGHCRTDKHQQCSDSEGAVFREHSGKFRVRREVRLAQTKEPRAAGTDAEQRMLAPEAKIVPYELVAMGGVRIGETCFERSASERVEPGIDYGRPYEDDDDTAPNESLANHGRSEPKNRDANRRDGSQV